MRVVNSAFTKILKKRKLHSTQWYTHLNVIFENYYFEQKEAVILRYVLSQKTVLKAISTNSKLIIRLTVTTFYLKEFFVILMTPGSFLKIFEI